MTGVELTVGRWFASSIIRKVIDLGSSYLGDNFDLHTRTREMLTNLEIQLPHIQSVIEAAEKRQITSEGLDTWLEQLKDAAYEAEDVLDHFEAKMIRESIKGKGKVTKIASSSGKMVKNIFFPPKELEELKSVVKKLDKQCMGVKHFIEVLQAHSDEGKEHLGNHGSKTDSTLANGVTIVGRDKEIELIWKMILKVIDGDKHKAIDDPNLQQGEGEGSSSLSDKKFLNWLIWGIPEKLMSIQTVIKGGNPQKNIKGDAPEQSKNIETTITIAEYDSINNPKIAVIPIVGIGGIGKTTVAKLIYNDERVKEHFALKAWVYISENHDDKKIMQDMLCSFKECGIGPGSTAASSENFNIVVTRLKKTIKNQRFLLMLDDLTEKKEDIWSSLWSVLSHGEVGSVVVVTTQSISIADTIRTLNVVNLTFLETGPFWKLFHHYAFGIFKFGKEPPLPPSELEDLKKIGKRISKRLYGLPLAGVVIGTLLSTRLEKKFWDN